MTMHMDQILKYKFCSNHNASLFNMSDVQTEIRTWYFVKLYCRIQLHLCCALRAMVQIFIVDLASCGWSSIQSCVVCRWQFQQWKETSNHRYSRFFKHTEFWANMHLLFKIFSVKIPVMWHRVQRLFLFSQTGGYHSTTSRKYLGQY
jgi:hypothetical protein